MSVNRRFITLSSLTAAVSVLLTVSASANNPCIPTTTSTADPAPSVFNDTLYLYCTQDANASLGIYNINCWGTTDLVNWISYGAVLTETNVPWSNGGAHLWAPHVVYFNGRYHLYFPETASSGTFYNGHAYNANSPHTAFTASSQQMVINGVRSGTNYTNGGLDPFVIMDTAGANDTNWLAWCITGITPNRNYIGRLSASGDSVLGTPTQLANANFYPDGSHYVEGQWWVQNNNLWYHIYACYYPGSLEQMGCATSSTLRGTYTWRGWLMGTNTNSAAGTIHPGCALYHGKWYLFWHCGGEEFGGTLLSGSAMRSTGAEQFTFSTASTPNPVVTTLWSSPSSWSVPKTYRGVGIPKAGNYPVADTIHMDRRSNITASTYAINGASITVRGGSDPTGHMVTSIGNGAWVRYDSVDFTPTSGRTITGITVRVAATAANTISVRLGSSTGTLLGTISVASTGALTTWSNATGTLTTTPPAGIQNLCLVFSGTAGTMNLNWVQFQTSSAIDPSASGKTPAATALSCRRLNRNTFSVAGAAGAGVRLFNVRGQEIAGAFASSGDRDLTVKLNSAALSSGSYVLSVKSSSGSVRVPFVY